MIYDKIVGYASVARLGGKSSMHTDEMRFYTRREELERAKELSEVIIRLSEEYK